jgi:hypothetical protein
LSFQRNILSDSTIAGLAGPAVTARADHESKGAEMNVNKHARHHGGAEPARLNWRRVHHTRLFWVDLFLMLVAITVYVMSDDLAWQPRIQR